MFRRTKTDLEIYFKTYYTDGSSGTSADPELSTAQDFANAFYDVTADYKAYIESKIQEDKERAEDIAEHLKDFPDEKDYEPKYWRSRLSSFKIGLKGTYKGEGDFKRTFANPEELGKFLVESGLTSNKKLAKVFAEDEPQQVPVCK